MRRLSGNIIIIMLLLMTASCGRNHRSVPVCRVENNHVIFRLDDRWDTATMKKVASLYDIDSSVYTNAFEKKREFIDKGEVWKVKRVTPHIIDLSKPIVTMSDTLIVNGYVFMITEQLATEGPNHLLSDRYGINILFRDGAFSYRNGEAYFWLPGYKDASEIYLSGTFNDWSTSHTLMTPVDSGWVAHLRLGPGKYDYKYIIDGVWTPDPVNTLREDDLNGDYNSVIYCPNYTFRINGYRSAREVRLTGDFLNWNQAGISMRRTALGWELPIYLREGTYAYKFITGNEWFTDPGNPDVRDDGNGNKNSFVSIGEQHTFTLQGYKDASKVSVAGTFNNWKPDDQLMKPSATGWTLSLALPAGNYEYKFIVDGRWLPDPANDNTTGSGEYTNSILCFKPNHTFLLEGYQNAREVMVTGSFNGFSNPGYRMSRKDGRWVMPVYLTPGKTIYKFIVDGEWILDPGNEVWEDNEYGTGNSVVWIDRQTL